MLTSTASVKLGETSINAACSEYTVDHHFDDIHIDVVVSSMHAHAVILQFSDKIGMLGSTGDDLVRS